jgi:hypothetical protein
LAIQVRQRELVQTAAASRRAQPPQTDARVRAEAAGIRIRAHCSGFDFDFDFDFDSDFDILNSPVPGADRRAAIIVVVCLDEKTGIETLHLSS